MKVLLILALLVSTCKVETIDAGTAAGEQDVDSPLPLSTVLHMLTIKLSSHNYLLWHKQILPLLSYQRLTGYVDGSIPKPSPTITSGEITSTNPAYTAWIAADQRALILLQSSLSEEAMAETLGHTTSHAVWTALETTYRHDSAERTHTLRESLRTLKKGYPPVTKQSSCFPQLCGIQRICWCCSHTGQCFGQEEPCNKTCFIY